LLRRFDVNKRQFRRKQAAILRMHCELKVAYPTLFNKPYCPFAIRIHEQLLDSGRYDSKLLKIHLKNITRHPLYYFNFLDDRVCYRLNIDGTRAEEIQESERLFARESLVTVLEHNEQRYRKKLGDKIIDEMVTVLGKV